MATGKFITLEGGEGAGKTTQIRLLAERLSANHQVVVTREPGGSPGAEDIRRLLVTGDPGRWQAMTETLLHFAARHDHLCRVIRPALAAGKWVISDRFADSTLAYQGYGHELGRDVVDRLYQLVIGDFKPDLTLILDIPVELGLARAKARSGGEDRYESMDQAFHLRLRQGFHEIARLESGRCVIVDASGSVESVQGLILAALNRHLADANG